MVVAKNLTPEEEEAKKLAEEAIKKAEMLKKLGIGKFAEGIKAEVVARNPQENEVAMTTLLVNLAYACYNRVENNRKQKFSPKTMIPILELIEYMDRDPSTANTTQEVAKEVLDLLIQGYAPKMAPVRYWDERTPIVYGVSKKGWEFISKLVPIPPNAIAWMNEPDKEPNREQAARNAQTVSAVDRLKKLTDDYNAKHAIKNVADATKTEEQKRAENEALEKAIDDATEEAIEEANEYEIDEPTEEDIDNDVEEQTSATNEDVTMPTKSIFDIFKNK